MTRAIAATEQRLAADRYYQRLLELSERLRQYDHPALARRVASTIESYKTTVWEDEVDKAEEAADPYAYRGLSRSMFG